MARAGRTKNVGNKTSDEKAKDFPGPGVEGEKGKQESDLKERRLKHIVAVLPSLKFPGDFTADNKPTVKAIEEKIGFDITAEERDEAVERILAGNPDFSKSFAIEKTEEPKSVSQEPMVITGEDVLRSMRAKGVKI